MRKSFFANAKTKAQNSCVVTVQLLSAADQRLCFCYIASAISLPKSSSNFLLLYSQVCVGPSRNPKDRFSRDAAQMRLIVLYLVLIS